MVTTTDLHPAARRRLAARLPATPPHDVVLRPYGTGGPEEMIVSADEQSFIDAVLADIERDDWRLALAMRRGKRRGSDGVLELSQPVHRRFHLVLVEAFCRQPGSPRLDPAKFDGAGFVLRRYENGAWQGWMSDGPRKVGWQPLSEQDLDPDPVRRAWTRPGAAGYVDALVRARHAPSPLAEDVLPLFAAPPELCEKVGRTLLFGVIPVTSGERIETAEPAPDYAGLPAAEAQAMRDHLSEYLKPRPAMAMPRAGQALDPNWNPLTLTAASGTEDARLHSFGIFLQQLMVELGAIPGGPAGRELLAALDEITLPMARDAERRATRTMQAGAFVAAAARILVAGEANQGVAGITPLTMPLEWPAISAGLGARLTQLSLSCLAQRFAALSPATPKFDGDSRRYAIRPFIRVKGRDDCPARLIWADYSEPFRVLPWWDGDGPATKIPLPDPRDLRKMKPNISFELPPSLANLLRGDMKKLKDGEGSTGGIDIFWLCSFSIPIITICAFIVLNIFLSLFDLFFRWMMFIKICIPFPKKGGAECMNSEARCRVRSPSAGRCFALPDEHGRLDWPDLAASVRQSIRIILSTRPGEQLMRPEFGAGLDRLLHAPNNAGDAASDPRLGDGLARSLGAPHPARPGRGFRSTPCSPPTCGWRSPIDWRAPARRAALAVTVRLEEG